MAATTTAEAKPHTYRFADPAAAQLAPGERGVRLRIGSSSAGADGKVACAGAELYAHPFTLRSCSTVLAKLLESCGTADGAGTEAGGAPPMMTVPLEGDDPLAWDDALGVVYGATCGEPFGVTWANVVRLLVLGDKYNMPGVVNAVAGFLRFKGDGAATRLQQHIAPSGDACWRWLLLASRAGVGDLVALCIGDVVQRGLSVTAANLRGLAAPDADALLDALAAQRKAATARAEAAEARAEAAEGREERLEQKVRDMEDKYEGAATLMGQCRHCRYKTFWKPNGNKARFCLNCGESV